MADDPKDQAMKDYEARKQALNEENAKAAVRMAASTPTPTQEECDMIKLGLLDPSMPKKDDGSGPPLFRVTEFREQRDMAPGAAGSYETRAAASGETAEQKAERERREAQQAARRDRR